MLKPSAEYNRRTAIIEGLRTGRSATEIIQSFRYPRSIVFDVVAIYTALEQSNKGPARKSRKNAPWGSLQLLKNSSADFGWPRTIVTKISIDCWCKRANNTSNCWGESWIQIVYIKDTTDALWSCQDKSSSSFSLDSHSGLNSSNLNLLNYVWSVVERITNKSRYSNVTLLRTVVKTAFVDMDSATLQHACEYFRLRIEAVIQANGEYIE